jgi:hypothetical protein
MIMFSYILQGRRDPTSGISVCDSLERKIKVCTGSKRFQGRLSSRSDMELEVFETGREASTVAGK